MILPGSTTEYCQTQKHDHLQTRQSMTLCSVDPPFAFNTQEETYRGTSDQSVSAYEQWRADSAASVCRSPQPRQNNTPTNIKDTWSSQKKIETKNRLATNFQKYDYYIFQLKCQKTEGRGRRGDDSRDEQWRPRALSPRFGIAVCSRGPWLASLAGAACGTSGGSDGVWEEVLRCGAPARHPKDRRQEALGKMLPSPVNSARRASECGAVSLVPLNRGQMFWSNSDVHFDIVHRGEKFDCIFSSKVQWRVSVLFPFGLLPEEHQTFPRYTVHKRAVFFLVFSVFTALCWFIGLQLKRFARNKCYDKTLWIDKIPSLFCSYSTKLKEHS